MRVPLSAAPKPTTTKSSANTATSSATSPTTKMGAGPPPLAATRMSRSGPSGSSGERAVAVPAGTASRRPMNG